VGRYGQRSKERAGRDPANDDCKQQQERSGDQFDHISSTIPKIPNFPNDIAALKQRLEADF